MEEAETWVMRQLDRVYLPVLNWAIANRRIVLTGAAGLVRAGTLALARWWEAELRPTGIRVAALEPRHHDAADSLHALVAVACVTVTVEASAPGAFAVGPR